MDDQIKKAIKASWGKTDVHSGIDKAAEIAKAYAGTSGAQPELIPKLFIDLANLFVLGEEPKK